MMINHQLNVTHEKLSQHINRAKIYSFYFDYRTIKVIVDTSYQELFVPQLDGDFVVCKIIRVG